MADAGRRALLVVPALALAALGLAWLAVGGGEPPAGAPAVTGGRPGPQPPAPRAPEVPLTPPPRPGLPAGEAPPAPAAPPGPAAAANEPPSAPAVAASEPPGRLRAARGRVVDAATGAPIAGAWVTWQPAPSELVAEVLGDPALREVDRGGAVTDGDGRFAVERLLDGAPRSLLHAAAPGWAPARERAGLREEVVLRLVRAGGLEVRLLGPVADGAWVEAEGPGGARRAVGAPWRLRDLEPGPWRVRLDGAAPVACVVEAGRTASVELRPPALVAVQGAVTPPPGEGLSLVLARAGDLGQATPGGGGGPEHVLRLAPDGAFAGTLPAGVYAARVVGASERVVQGLARVGPGPTTLALALAPTTPVEVVVRGLARDDQAPPQLGLVGRDGEPPELVALDLLAPPQGGVARYGGQAPAGAFAAFLGATHAGDVDVPAAGPVERAVTPARVVVRWALPAALREGEVVRGGVALVPAAFAGRGVGARFAAEAWTFFEARRDGAPTDLEVLAPGRYLLAGETELGAFSQAVEVPGAGEVEVVVALPE